MAGIIRQYGSIFINLSKVISFEQSGHSIRFTLPLSNWYQHHGVGYSVDRQTYMTTFSSAEECQREIEEVVAILNKYHKME